MHLPKREHDVESAERDRLADETEIDVTLEMIEAGVGALYEYDNDPMFCSDDERVLRIFLAMTRAK